MITANELKTKGIKAIEEQLSQTSEAAITVHGKVKYVAMTVELFEKMRLAELEVAYMLKFNCKLCEMEIWEKDAELEYIDEDEQMGLVNKQLLHTFQY